MGKSGPPWIKFIDDGFLLNSAKTAEFFDVTPRTLIDWNKRGAPKEDRGWWDPKKLMAWLGKSTGEQSGMSLEARKLKADAEYREAKAEREQRMNAILEGQYLLKEEIINEWARRVAEVKSGLMALSRKIAGNFSDPNTRTAVEKVLSDEIYELLEQYSRNGRYTPGKVIKKKRKG